MAKTGSVEVRRRGALTAGLIVLTLLPFAAGSAGAAVAAGYKGPADVLLKGGTLYDGSGREARAADVAIHQGKIVAVGKLDGVSAARVVECRGLIVAPGFIDLHTHCNPVGPLAMRRNLNYLTQGCTTVVSGNCGMGTADIGDYFTRLERDGVGTNVILLVPHGSVRLRAMSGANRAPTAQELQHMRELVDRGMRDGAWGMSTGLIYAPGMFAKTEELVELAKVVARHHGLYVSHIRHESRRLPEGVREVLEIAREARLAAHISHLKATGPSAWGLVRKAAMLIEESRAQGLTVTADQYPYIATSTNLAAILLPATRLPNGLKDFNRRMQNDPAYRQAVRQVVESELAENPRIVIASCRKHPDWTGKSLADIAAQLKTGRVEAAIRVQADGGASIVRFSLSEDDVRYVMTLPWVATASDGSTMVPTAGIRPHPRNFGTFPRKIGFYAQREKVISLVQAIRSATGLPADVLHLPDRGYLRTGYVADVVVFDPATFIDRATFDDPQRYSPGVRWLFLAGQAAIADGKAADALYGRPIRHATSAPGKTP